MSLFYYLIVVKCHNSVINKQLIKLSDDESSCKLAVTRPIKAEMSQSENTIKNSEKKIYAVTGRCYTKRVFFCNGGFVKHGQHSEMFHFHSYVISLNQNYADYSYWSRKAMLDLHLLCFYVKSEI